MARWPEIRAHTQMVWNVAHQIEHGSRINYDELGCGFQKTHSPARISGNGLAVCLCVGKPKSMANSLKRQRKQFLPQRVTNQLPMHPNSYFPVSQFFQLSHFSGFFHPPPPPAYAY